MNTSILRHRHTNHVQPSARTAQARHVSGRTLRSAAQLAVMAALSVSSYALTGAAHAQNVHTCVMQVSTKSATPGGSGTMSLGADKQVNGATIQDAASQCHEATRQAFAGNAGWYNPTNVCGRYPNTWNIEVMASDFFKDMGHSGGVNYVDGYKINCGGPAVWNHTLHVVPGTL